MCIQGPHPSCCWFMSIYGQDLSDVYQMYGYDTRREPRMTSCPICYCMVEEKFMSMHVLWHEEPDEEEEHTQHVPINQVKYEF
jgi:hypothetical protein